MKISTNFRRTVSEGLVMGPIGPFLYETLKRKIKFNGLNLLQEEQTENQTPPDKISKAVLSSDTLTKMNNLIFNGKTPQVIFLKLLKSIIIILFCLKYFVCQL